METTEETIVDQQPQAQAEAVERKPAKTAIAANAPDAVEGMGAVEGGRIVNSVHVDHHSDNPAAFVAIDFYETLPLFAGALVRFFIGPVAGGGHVIECIVEIEDGEEPRLAEAKQGGRVRINVQEIIEKFERMPVRWQLQRVE